MNPIIYLTEPKQKSYWFGTSLKNLLRKGKLYSSWWISNLPYVTKSKKGIPSCGSVKHQDPSTCEDA